MNQTPSCLLSGVLAVTLGLQAGGTGAEPKPGVLQGLKNEAKQRIEAANADAKKEAQNAVGEMDAMMKAWAEASAVTPSHELLHQFAGTWTGEVEIWMAPGAPSEKSTGTMVTTAEMGGRWMRQRWTGEMMGQPFEGEGYFGYDNIKKKHIGTWIDTMSTGLMVMEGDYDAAKKSFDMVGTFSDPMGATNKARHVITIQSVDKHTFEMYHTGPDGKETLDGRIVYTRKK